MPSRVDVLHGTAGVDTDDPERCVTSDRPFAPPSAAECCAVGRYAGSRWLNERNRFCCRLALGEALEVLLGASCDDDVFRRTVLEGERPHETTGRVFGGDDFRSGLSDQDELALAAVLDGLGFDWAGSLTGHPVPGREQHTFAGWRRFLDDQASSLGFAIDLGQPEPDQRVLCSLGDSG